MCRPLIIANCRADVAALCHQMSAIEQRYVLAAINQRFAPGAGHECKVYIIEDMTEALAVFPG